ncbi:MAG: SLOG family protein [Candidatus Pelethousia sp.]|nr:SLOG family protein [Candidatus Pelethousia sp.]
MKQIPACCFIGHKPQEFHFGHDELYEDCLLLKAALAREIKAILAQGITTFFTGMALGADMWCAEIVLALREEAPELGIELTAVAPFAGQANRWSNDYRERYFNILERAQEVVVLQEHYAKNCLAKCGQYMADRSTHLLAVYNGSPGRTRDALEYARKRNLTCIVINPQTLVSERQSPLRRFILLKKADH